MNYVDQNFNFLINQLKGKSIEELFLHMKERYISLPKEIKNSIETFFKQFPYWGNLNETENDFEEIQNKAQSFLEHLKDYEWLYNHLQDYRSKKLLFAILYNWYDYDFQTLKSLMDGTYCHYFDLDLLACHDEVFVDVGAYIGDTILDFIHSYGENGYQKIYAYEMTKESCNTLKENLKNYSNIKVVEKAVSSQSEILSMCSNATSSSANTITEDGIKVEAVSLDEDIKDKITLIKMDIEGYEKKALLGCTKHIQEDHPKLLISVYHNHEDLWKIARMIDEICPGYQFYLRFYGSYIFPTEIVLFAIYKEKETTAK